MCSTVFLGFKLIKWVYTDPFSPHNLLFHVFLFGGFIYVDTSSYCTVFCYIHSIIYLSILSVRLFSNCESRWRSDAHPSVWLSGLFMSGEELTHLCLGKGTAGVAGYTSSTSFAAARVSFQVITATTGAGMWYRPEHSHWGLCHGARGFWDPLSGWWGQNYFHNNIKHYLHSLVTPL